tara:strand:+ start:6835 stop:7200 length:366 start_codon:yes stop_codon:yes gene_type:complete
MSNKKVIKPVALAVGAALAGSFALGSAANAEPAASPFAMTSLSSGYMLGLGEGGCGGDKGAEASCGGDKEGGAGDKDAEASCGGDKDAEASCGGDKDAEASCGGDKDAEGACGEGSCGGAM